MKKNSIVIAFAGAMMLSGCGFTGGTAANGDNSLGTVLGNILGAATNGGAVENILYDVIGATKLSQEDVIGTWRYRQPGCAFTTEKLLAKAGGEVAAAEARQKLQPTYQKLGVTSANTYFTFKQDNTFEAKVDGQPISGTYSYNESTSEVKLQTLLLSTTGYLTRNSRGISLLFESKKLLTALQVAGAASGNNTLGTIGELSKNYDGIRMGFDLAK